MPAEARRRVAGFLLSVLVLAIVVTAFVIAAAYARSGYQVTFDEDGDVVIYQGRDFLWFEPTVEAVYVYDRDQLDEDSIERIEREYEFANRDDAERLPQRAGATHDDDHHDDHDHHDDDNDHDDVDHDHAGRHDHDAPVGVARLARRRPASEPPMATASPSPGPGARPSCRSS